MELSRRTAQRLIVCTVLALLAPGANAEETATSIVAMIRSRLPTVVSIHTSKAEPSQPRTGQGEKIQKFVGSGFVIDPSGLIVTNYHVVEGAFEIEVTFADGSRLQGKTLNGSRLADLALVKVPTDHPLPTAEWGASDTVQVGDQVFAVGNPFGIGLSVSAGIVSGLNRDLQNSPYDSLIQTDATINHGNSGGPLFDAAGYVVGVDSAILSPTTGSAGLGFAIPSRSARFVIDRLQKYGWVRPGWIGIKLQQVTYAMADAMGMARPQGAVLAYVNPEGPAARAGLAIGDIIVRCDGVVPSDERELLRLIAHTDVGDAIKLTVLHDGREEQHRVTVGEWPRKTWDKFDAPTPVVAPKAAIPPDLGLTLGMLSDADKKKLDLPAGWLGVAVSGIAPHAEARDNGLSPGDVILRVGSAPVTTPAQVLAGFKAARAAARNDVMVLVWPKVREVPGPKWIALPLTLAGG